MTAARSESAAADARRERRQRLAGRPENVDALRADRLAAYERLLSQMNVAAVLRSLGCDGDFNVVVVPSGGGKSRVFVDGFDRFDGEYRRFKLVRSGSRYSLTEVAR